MSGERRPDVGILALAPLDASQAPLLNLIDIMRVLANRLVLITLRRGLLSGDNSVCIHEVGYAMGTTAVTKVMRYAWLQLRLAWRVVLASRTVDLWVFFMASPLAIPALTARILRKRIMLVLPGSYALAARFSGDSLWWPLATLEGITFSLADRLVIYSPSLIKEWSLDRHRHKISVAQRHFVDFGKFKVQKPVTERDGLVGYIGRLSQEKGVLPFMEAIPKVLQAGDNCAFLIGGDGSLRSDVEVYAAEWKGEIEYAGWIPHADLPRYLNRLRLLVLPSYTEGLPNIVLEAMACGTPVLATPVGAIPDIIADGETGFIMENNSPECIAANILRALHHPDLERIARTARALVEREFTFDKAVERYLNVISSLG